MSALEKALAANPNPAYLVETLPEALREVTGRDYQVLDRSTWDVTGAFGKTQVMIRDGDVGLWPGYAARAYPLLDTAGAQRGRAARDRSGRRRRGWPAVAHQPGGQARLGAAAADHRRRPEPLPDTSAPVGDAEAGASLIQDTPAARDVTPEPG